MSEDRQSPLVSFLTPVWNEAEHIRQMIESVQAQSDDRWEIVFVDDGSTDATVTIIEEYAARDGRIRLVARGEKLGKVAAFNLAHRRSKGSVICHLGGDDLATGAAVTARLDALGARSSEMAVAFFKIRAFSVDPGIGRVLPRGVSGSRSGPSITMTRRLADEVFPIPQELPSEDLWLGEAAYGMADHVLHRQEVVCNYRMHAGNSNPRAKPFAQMSDAMSARQAFAPLLLDRKSEVLRADVREELATQWRLEQLRAEGRTWRILSSRVPLVERVAVASMSQPSLWRLRQRLGIRVSGWRSR